MLRNQKCLTCYISMGPNQIQVSVGCDSHLQLTTWVSNRSWDFYILFITSKTHDIARHMTSQKLLMFRVRNWNDRPTRCSTPPSQIVPYRNFYFLGPVVQSVVSLTSSLRVISLTVLADSIHNILIFFAEKMWVAFAKNFSIFAYHSI